jgi:hypothetical protein
MGKLAFVICVEKGELEGQAELLCRSIRQFCGRYRDAPIHTFAPRPGAQVGRCLLNVFDALGVVHHTEPLNVEYAHYPIANKIFVSARAEEILNEDVLVFVDTDTIFTGAPLDLDLSSNFNAAARPCNRWDGGKSSMGLQDPRENYWQMMYTVAGLKVQPFVRTVIDQKEVRAYFSGGLVACRRRARIFRQWRSDFLLLMETGNHTGDKLAGLLNKTEAMNPCSAARIRNMDELSLAITLGRIFDRVCVLDNRYNYLLYRRSILPSPWNRAQLEELVHVHYRFWFKKPGYLDEVVPCFCPGGRTLGWLKQHLPLKPVSFSPEHWERSNG